MALSETWFLEGYIDFELQKYRLLGYLQEVHKHFDENKLYPQLGDVIFHYNNLHSFRENKQLLQGQFPKELSKVDLQKLELAYKEMLQDDDLMQELEEITSYALERMKHTIENGTELYELVEQRMHIEPVGIMPLYKNEGYMFLRHGMQPEVQVYNYTISLFEHKNARYKGLRIDYVDSWKKNISTTYEHIKKDIISTIRTLPNPAVYSIESEWQVPVDETLLPIAKRLLVRYIETNAA